MEAAVIVIILERFHAFSPYRPRSRTEHDKKLTANGSDQAFDEWM
jgi:hypothetical protein